MAVCDRRSNYDPAAAGLIERRYKSPCLYEMAYNIHAMRMESFRQAQILDLSLTCGGEGGGGEQEDGD